jgi:prolyl-tRNA synthetase
VRTIQDLVEFDGGAAAESQIKTLVYVLDDELVLVLLRGDHALVEQKLQDGTGATELRPARADEIRSLLGADAGSLGAVAVSGKRIVADPALQGRSNMTTGANVDDHHFRGVSVERDIAIAEWIDLRAVAAGEPCPECGESLEIFRAIEAGHIFKLEAMYSAPLDAKVLDADGRSVPLIMGSYGIGVERNIAATVEVNHDDKGIVWPVSVAPYEAVITVVKVNDEETMNAADEIYAQLGDAGIDVIIDDRNERPGVKFNDAELIGIPYRVTVGPRGLADGVVEITERRSGESETVPVAEATAHVIEKVTAAR